MRRSRFQNHVASSDFTLPVTMLWALLCVCVKGGDWSQIVVDVACVVPCAYLLIELQNRNALICIRTRLTTSIFLAFWGLATILHPTWEGYLLLLCFLGICHLLARAYQERMTSGVSFYIFALLSITTLLHPCLVVFFPVLWFVMAAYLKMLNLKSMATSLLGFFAPYWLLLTVRLVLGEPLGLLSHWQTLLHLPTPNLEQFLVLGNLQLALLGGWFCLFLVALINYRREGFYKDRTRVRMIHYSLIRLVEVLLLLILALPTLFQDLYLPLLALSSPLLAHFFALTNKWYTNALFVLSVFLFPLTFVLQVVGLL